jgi:hypothetical protein
MVEQVRLTRSLAGAGLVRFAMVVLAVVRRDAQPVG